MKKHFILLLALIAPTLSFSGDGTERGGGDDRAAEMRKLAWEVYEQVKDVDFYKKRIDMKDFESVLRKAVWRSTPEKKLVLEKFGVRREVDAINDSSDFTITFTHDVFDRSSRAQRRRIAFHESMGLLKKRIQVKGRPASQKEKVDYDFSISNTLFGFPMAPTRTELNLTEEALAANSAGSKLTHFERYVLDHHGKNTSTVSRLELARKSAELALTARDLLQDTALLPEGKMRDRLPGALLQAEILHKNLRALTPEMERLSKLRAETSVDPLLTAEATLRQAQAIWIAGRINDLPNLLDEFKKKQRELGVDTASNPDKRPKDPLFSVTLGELKQVQVSHLKETLNVAEGILTQYLQEPPPAPFYEVHRAKQLIAAVRIARDYLLFETQSESSIK